MSDKSGVITGTVSDANTQKSIADAIVSVRGSSLQNEQVAVTGGNGAFRIPNLPSGTYTMTIEASGYKNYSRSSLTLNINATLKLEIKLQTSCS